jgi:hypothetical protein
MTRSAVFGEKSLSKVGAAFETAERALEAADRLKRETGIDPDHVRLLEPDDRAIGRKLEPETRGIFRTLTRAHLSLGAAGVLLGVLIALVLVMIDVPVFTSNPGYTLMVFAFFGAIAGLLLGGLVTLRPDHGRLIAWVKESSGGGKWFVLVHARGHDEERKVKEALSAVSDKVVGTL